MVVERTSFLLLVDVIRDLDAFLNANTMLLHASEDSDRNYQCLMCGKVARDYFNIRKHLIVHLVKVNPALVRRLDDHVRQHTIKCEDTNQFTCIPCQKVLKNTRFTDLRLHVICKHMKF